MEKINLYKFIYELLLKNDAQLRKKGKKLTKKLPKFIEKEKSCQGKK